MSNLYRSAITNSSVYVKLIGNYSFNKNKLDATHDVKFVPCTVVISRNSLLSRWFFRVIRCFHNFLLLLLQQRVANWRQLQMTKTNQTF